MSQSRLPFSTIIGAATGGAALALLIVIVWALFARKKSQRLQRMRPRTAYRESLEAGYLGPTVTVDKFDSARSLQTPSPAWLYDDREKGRSSPSAGSDSLSQTSSRYGPLPSVDYSKISTPMLQRPRRVPTGQNALLSVNQRSFSSQPSLDKQRLASPVLSHETPALSDPATTTASVKPSRETGKKNRDRLQAILEDDKAKALHVKETSSIGLGTRWINGISSESGPPSRSRAKIKEPIRETAYSRQSFMTATSASVYSYHGPEPVGVAYGGEEYE